MGLMDRLSSERYRFLEYRAPLTQIIMLGFVMFGTAGMFNAVNGMGGGGQVDGSVAAKSNTALYSCFAVFGVFAGAINNTLGPKLLMTCGALTYILYVGSYLAFNHIASTAFSVAAGAILGIGAALIWTAQGTLMMSYPTEDRKGLFISVFWVIFNLGGVIGGFIPFGVNYHSKASSVSDATYIAFMAIMLLSAMIPMFMMNPSKVIRDDGTHVVLAKSRSAGEEVMGVLKALTDWRMLCLLPLFLASNWFYTYQFNGVNGFLFNVRTRGLNNVFYWGMQMVTALAVGRFLDSPTLSRSTKAKWGLLGLAAFFSVVWGGGLALQLRYKRTDTRWELDFLNTKQAAGPMILYLCYGMVDAVLQSWCYWVMGALTNEPAVLARYAGLYKGLQSAGGAVAWSIDAAQVPYLVQLITNWSIMLLAVPFAFMVARQVKDTSKDIHDTAPVEKRGMGESRA